MNKGFSLVELIVVIAIMAILVGVAVPVYTQYIGNANDAVDEQAIGEVEHAIEVLLIDNEITNPANGSEIKLTDDGIAVATNASQDLKDFVAELNKIVNNVKLKSTTLEVTFTINDYSVTTTESTTPAQTPAG